jgi:hypothetical protein
LIIGLMLVVSCWSSVTAQELEQGFVGPGGCTSKEECRAYCDIDGNKEECLTFAVDNGMMTEVEADKARKFLNQTGPGGCRGDECKTYCEDPANTEECISFAEANGLIQPGEGERFRKMRQIESKGGPGGCKGEECRAYCEDESHRDECFAFAKENGLLNEKQIQGYETGIKIKQKIKEVGGPGGCKSEKECHDYCSDIDKVEECVAFGAKHSGKSPEEVRRMIEDFKNFKDMRERGEGFEPPNMERKPNFPEAREGQMPGKFTRPEGCDSPESCRKMCMENPEKCGFMRRPDESMMRPPETQRNTVDENTIPVAPTNNESTPTTEPTSYDHSKSFIANMAAAFLAPFRD